MYSSKDKVKSFEYNLRHNTLIVNTYVFFQPGSLFTTLILQSDRLLAFSLTTLKV